MKRYCKKEFLPNHLKDAPAHRCEGTYTNPEFVVLFCICGVHLDGQDLTTPKTLDTISTLVEPMDITPEQCCEAVEKLLAQKQIRKVGEGYVRASHVVARHIKAGEKETFAVVEMCKDGYYTFMLPVPHQDTEWFDLAQSILDYECNMRSLRGQDFSASMFSTLAASPELMLALALRHPRLASIKLSELPGLDEFNPRKAN